MRPVLLAAFAAVLVSAPAALRAEEAEKKEPTDHERWLAVSKQLPPPSKEHGFHLDGEYLFMGYATGTAAISAEPHRDGDTMVWRLREKLTMGLDPETRWTYDMEVFTTRTFEFLRGSTIASRGTKDWIYRWERSKTGIRMLPAWKEVDDPLAVACEGPILVGMAGGVLLARMRLSAPDEVVAPTVPLLRPWNGAEDVHRFPVTIGKARAGRWQGVRADLVSLAAVHSHAQVAFARPDHALLGVTMQQPDGGPGYVFVPEGQARPVAPASVLTDPPATPQALAAQVFLAMSTKDVDHFDRLVHWESMHASLRENEKDPDQGVEGTRTRALEYLDGLPRWGTWPKELYPLLLRGLALDFAVKETGKDRASVTLPEGWPQLFALTAGRFEDRWLLTRWPGR